MATFTATDLNGLPVWVDYDGTEGIGIWLGNPEDGWQPLSLEDTDRLIEWFHEFEENRYDD